MSTIHCFEISIIDAGIDSVSFDIFYFGYILTFSPKNY